MIIVIESSDEELISEIKCYAKEKQWPYYKVVYGKPSVLL